MNPRERFVAALKGEPTDRVPILLKGVQSITSHDQIAQIADPGRREIAERIFPLQVGFLDYQSGINRYLVTPGRFIEPVGQGSEGNNTTITSRITTPKGDLTAIQGRNASTNMTWQLKYPVESMDDIEKIRSVPWEMPASLKPPDRSKLPTGFSRRNLTQLRVSSPFVCVAGMMPYDYYLLLCATELPLITELTVQCHERIKDLLRMQLSSRSIDYVWFGGCEWLTPPMGSPALYEELVQPFEQELIEMSHQAGAFVHVHCHGRVRSTLESVIQRGADILEPTEPPPDGDIPLADAKALARGRMVVAGNIEARVLENEDHKAVRRAVFAAFEGGRQHMVLMESALAVRKFTPKMIRNYHAMIDVWEDVA